MTRCSRKEFFLCESFLQKDGIKEKDQFLVISKPFLIESMIKIVVLLKETAHSESLFARIRREKALNDVESISTAEGVGNGLVVDSVSAKSNATSGRGKTTSKSSEIERLTVLRGPREREEKRRREKKRKREPERDDENRDVVVGASSIGVVEKSVGSVLLRGRGEDNVEDSVRGHVVPKTVRGQHKILVAVSKKPHTSVWHVRHSILVQMFVSKSASEMSRVSLCVEKNSVARVFSELQTSTSGLDHSRSLTHLSQSVLSVSQKHSLAPPAHKHSSAATTGSANTKQTKQHSPVAAVGPGEEVFGHSHYQPRASGA